MINMLVDLHWLPLLLFPKPPEPTRNPLLKPWDQLDCWSPWDDHRAQVLLKHQLAKSHEITIVCYCPGSSLFVSRQWCHNFHQSEPRQARQFAQVLQFTWPGCPLVYYGDELGLEGADDPHNRAPMPWGKAAWNVERVLMPQEQTQEPEGDLWDVYGCMSWIWAKVGEHNSNK